MADDLSDVIQQAAANPARVRTDNTEAQQHDLDKLVIAAQYVDAKVASRRSALPIRLGKFRPSGTV
jgi:hypothetical protein